jgi:hypothetical protein
MTSKSRDTTDLLLLLLLLHALREDLGPDVAHVGRGALDATRVSLLVQRQRLLQGVRWG